MDIVLEKSLFLTQASSIANALPANSTLPMPDYNQRLFDTCALMIGLVLASFAGNLLSAVLVGLAGERVLSRLRTRLYDHMLRMEMGFFGAPAPCSPHHPIASRALSHTDEAWPSPSRPLDAPPIIHRTRPPSVSRTRADEIKAGELVSSLGSDTMLVQQACTKGLSDLISAFGNINVIMISMFISSWRMSLIVIGFAVGMILFAVPASKTIGKLEGKYQHCLAKAVGVSTQAIGAMRMVRSFGAEEVELRRYTRYVGDANKASWPRDPCVLRYGSLKQICTGFTFNVWGLMSISGLIAVVCYGLSQALNGSSETTIGTTTAFLQFQNQLIQALTQLIYATMAFASALGGSVRIVELLNRPSHIPLELGAKPATCSGEVRLEDVVFAYPTRMDSKVLHGLSITFPPDSSTALVGSSGCGKSSIISLLMRFYDPVAGRVTIDGHNVARVDSSWLRQHVGLVQQEPVLFNLTIKENLLYGVQASTSLTVSDFSDEDIERVCRNANAHNFVTEFPEGYNTMIGEHGTGLSGGQKQRLAIARTLLLSPRILLFDEATCARMSPHTQPSLARTNGHLPAREPSPDT